MITLAIDAMSGDEGLAVTLPAAQAILQQYPDLRLLLVGCPQAIEQWFARHNATVSANMQVQAAKQVVEMQDSPAFALRKKKDSSMRVAINLVHSRVADACISAGNTGALVATARFVLKTIPGVARPAICTALPRIQKRTRQQGHTYMLDLGANVDSPAEILFQFGQMGAALIQCIKAKARPSVGLLNIGSEDLKGNERVKGAAVLFKQSQLNYAGFVEANEIYVGQTDLVVCDGFAGNVALKATEGVAEMIRYIMREEFTRSLSTKMAGLVAKPVLTALERRLDHRRYNGASLLGLRGTVIKSHGSADALGFKHAIEVAIEQVKNNLVNRIEAAITAV